MCSSDTQELFKIAKYCKIVLKTFSRNFQEYIGVCYTISYRSHRHIMDLTAIIIHVNEFLCI